MKVCIRCGLMKAPIEFSRNGGKDGARQAYCKDCRQWLRDDPIVLAYIETRTFKEKLRRLFE